MTTNDQLVERIERAMTATPICGLCGQPTRITEREGAIWLECSSLTEPRDRLRSLLRFDFPRFHVQQPVIELDVAA